MTKGLDPDYNSLNKKETLSDNELSSKPQVLDHSKPQNNVVQDATFPTEIVPLPSKGLGYPVDSPLRSGQIEIKQMTTKEEEILSSPNLVQKGLAIDKLLQELIVTEIDFNDLLLGDKNAIMLAARILAYGQEYETKVTCPVCGESQPETFNLNVFDEKDIDENILNSNNEYDFTFPSGVKIKFKLLTQGDEKNIESELKSIKQFQIKSGIKDPVQKDLSVRLKYVIIELEGKRDRAIIKTFVDTLPSKDSLALRRHIKEINPGIDLSYIIECRSCGSESMISVPITVNFFWPDARV